MDASSSEPPATFANLIELIRHRAASGVDRAFTFLPDGEAEGASLSYAQLEHRARAIAARLQSRGYSGERALLFYPPGLDFLAAFCGCLFAGVAGIPVFPAWQRRHLPRLAAIVADSQADLVLSNARTAARSQELFSKTRGLEGLRWQATDDGEIPLDLAAQWREPGIDSGTLAFLQYTSGSTGAPRGVMVSHANLLHNCASIQRVCGFTPESLGVVWLPHYHDMGLIGGLLEPLYTGFPVVLMPPAAFLQRPLRWLAAASRYQADTLVAPNFAYEHCVRKIPPEQREGLRLESVRVALTGAEPVRWSTLERFTEVFGPCGFRGEAFRPAYGLAEATLIVSGHAGSGGAEPCKVDAPALDRGSVEPLAPGVRERILVTCGEPVQGTTVLIVDPESRTPCAAGRVGEIWVAGPGVAQGYWMRPDETAETFGARLAAADPARDAGPFLRTGDLGFLDHGGLIVTGRLKDLIIIRGSNHYSQDLELTVERSHPALRAGCGAAFSVELAGEERLAVVQEVEQEGAGAGEEIVEAIRQSLVEAHEVQPSAIVLIAPRSIPKTSSGKIQRFACREAFLQDRLSVVFQWRAEAADGDTDADVSDDGADAAARPAPRSGLVWDYAGSRSPVRRAAAGASANGAASSGHDSGGATGSRAQAHAEPIALIGLGCRFPGAENLEALWRLLREGGDAVTEVPPDRWDADALYDPVPGTPGKMSTRWGGFLRDVDKFDCHFFGISPREATVMDPQQRLLLEIAWEALESAGQAPDQLAGSRTGVFVGIGGFDYSNVMLHYEQHLERLNAYCGTGLAHSIAANRLSYLLDLRGPSLALDTACSSSLVAIHLACQSLRSGLCEMALAGGVNLILSPEVTVAFSHARMMASDGRCKTFDARADGYVRGEGCGLVVLKRLSQAVRDRDRILAVIKGSAVNQDGRTAGISAPNGLAQQAVIREALAEAGVSPRDLSYIEIHGTGTAIGDPIEVEAVKNVLGESAPGDAPCLIGSVKANIGHLENASGVAGLAKAVLCLQHGEIPGQLHLRQVNPRISLENSRVCIARELQPWPDVPRRVAGVNSFGFGGTNAHVTIEAPPPVARDASDLRRPLHLFTLSGRTATALQELARRYEGHIAEHPGEDLADICFTANAGRSHFAHRLALVAETSAELRERLADFAAGRAVAGLCSGHAEKRSGLRVAFLFAGKLPVGLSGPSSLSGSTRKLFETEPVFCEALEECAAFFEPDLDVPLLSLLFPQPAKAAEAAAALRQPRFAEPALFALQYALGKLWSSWGIKPDAAIGYGAGAAAGEAVAAGQLPTAAEWRRKLERPAPLEGAILALESGESDVVLEMLPDGAFAETRRELGIAGGTTEWLSSLGTEQDDWRVLLESVARLYVIGAAIHWNEFERPYRAHKISLPTYPFERERCWEDPPSANGRERPLDPLLGRRLVSALPSLQFEARLGSGNLRFLRDHRVQGSAVFPAAGYLEMAVAASQEIFGPGSHALENVTFHQAALIPEHGARTVQLIVSPASSGSAMFQVFSLDPDAAASDWTLHAFGEIRMAAPDAPQPVEDRNLIAQIQARAVEKGDKLEFYTAVRRRGLEYGPAFQGVEWYWRCRDESLVQLGLPAAAGKSEPYRIHPALLDACLHSVAASFPKDDVSSRGLSTYVPVSMARLRLFAAPGERLFSHCLLRPGSQLGADFLEADVRLLDENNRLVGELTGVKVKRIGGEAEPEVRGEFKDWAYELAWVPKPAVTQPHESDNADAGRWLIVSDRRGVAAALAKLIQYHGGSCTVVPPGTALDFPNDFPYRGVVHLAALDAADASAASLAAARSEWTGMLRLVQTLARVPDRRKPRLILVTRGTQAVSPESKVVAPAAAPLWGLARTADLEYPDLRFTRVDFDPAGAAREVRMLHEELYLQPSEREIGYRSEVRYVSRLVRRSERGSRTGRLSAFPDSPSFRLETSHAGSFENLVLQPASRTNPGPGEVEVQVFAAGLNFRDVMNATGLYPGGPIPFGAECAGKISAVGAGVADFQVGDEVLAIASGSFAASVIAREEALMRKPASLEWAEAATIPIAFLTAYYALHQLAGLAKGERVLIHAAAGGVGLAAVQLAQRAGAEIFATAGTPEKRAYLESLGVQHIMDSRSLLFADEVMRITGGKGVDVVLNSLPGEFAVKSLALLGSCGRFIEIGKTDIYQNKQIGLFPFRNNLSYFACDLERLCRERPQMVRSLFLELMDLFARGELRPLPLKTFPIEDASKAFRYMAGRRNLGKVVLSFDTAVSAATGARGHYLRPDGTYLITGGLGSLGLATAMWMFGKGVRNLVLVGRGEGSAYSRTAQRDLQAEGAKVMILKADVADEEQFARALAKVREEMPPLRGIIHAAGVLDDRALINLDAESLLRVMAPKVQGAWNLHALTAGMPLDFFVLFSSIASITGSPGQANYSAANAFLDALAHYRRGQNLPATSINWGPWAEVGMAARPDRARRFVSRAISPIAPTEGLIALERILESDPAEIAVVSANWPELARSLGSREPLALLSELLAEEGAAAQQGQKAAAALFSREELLALDAAGQQAMLLAHLQKSLAEVMSLEPSALDPEESLNNLGIDSLMALEVQESLETSLALRLPMEIMMGMPTLNELTRRLLVLLQNSSAREAAAAPRPLPAAAPQRTS